mgnify:CR=1 FL=1
MTGFITTWKPLYLYLCYYLGFLPRFRLLGELFLLLNTLCCVLTGCTAVSRVKTANKQQGTVFSSYFTQRKVITYCKEGVYWLFGAIWRTWLSRFCPILSVDFLKSQPKAYISSIISIFISNNDWKLPFEHIFGFFLCQFFSFTSGVLRC